LDIQNNFTFDLLYTYKIPQSLHLPAYQPQPILSMMNQEPSMPTIL
jgi:hypothetical protein